MIDLKPCPFCRSDRVAFYPDEEQPYDDTVTGFIWCHGCGVSTDSYYSEARAAEKWNRRAGKEPILVIVRDGSTKICSLDTTYEVYIIDQRGCTGKESPVLYRATVRSEDAKPCRKATKS